ncbi:hypothetical protein MTO96_020147 [Rhipicephalus appendiculatus]
MTPQFGVDSRWSWISACFCSWVLFLAMATPRVTGILFYGVVETFRVSREEASWSVGLAGTVLVLAGPVAGALCQRFSCRTVLIVCSPLAGIAASLCYLAESIIFIAVSFGIVLGCALSGMYVAANVLVAQHFEKRRAMACSLVYTVSGLNNVLLPPLVEFLRTTYGVRGAFLLYGAILLNAIPPVIVLRSPPWLTKSKLAPKNKEPGLEDTTNVTGVSSAGPSENGATADLSLEYSSYSHSESPYRQSASPSISTVAISSRVCLCDDEGTEKLSQVQKVLSCLRLGPTAKQFLTWSFLVNGLSFAAVFFTAGVFVLIPADLSRRPRPEALAVRGAAYEWLVWSSTLPPMIAAAFFMGATCGSRLSLQAPTLVQDFGIGTLPTMMGGVSFCAGLSLLTRPVLIGYYRDTLGNYTGLLHSMAALNAFFVCMWTAKLIVKRITAMKTQGVENKETSGTDLQALGNR